MSYSSWMLNYRLQFNLNTLSSLHLGGIWTAFKAHQQALCTDALVFRKGVTYKVKSKEKNHPNKGHPSWFQTDTVEAVSSFHLRGRRFEFCSMVTLLPRLVRPILGVIIVFFQIRIFDLPAPGWSKQSSILPPFLCATLQIVFLTVC